MVVVGAVYTNCFYNSALSLVELGWTELELIKKNYSLLSSSRSGLNFLGGGESEDGGSKELTFVSSTMLQVSPCFLSFLSNNRIPKRVWSTGGTCSRTSGRPCMWRGGCISRRRTGNKRNLSALTMLCCLGKNRNNVANIVRPQVNRVHLDLRAVKPYPNHTWPWWHHLNPPQSFGTFHWRLVLLCEG